MSFSALQRAENSSIRRLSIRTCVLFPFQCSSASRKFLNVDDEFIADLRHHTFQCSSASRKFLNASITSDRYWHYMFQCSSASRKFLNGTACRPCARRTQFQCSSASRKFLNYKAVRWSAVGEPVSVLFSEPKIPQCRGRGSGRAPALCFSALQRAENSSIILLHTSLYYK